MRFVLLWSSLVAVLLLALTAPVYSQVISSFPPDPPAPEPSPSLRSLLQEADDSGGRGDFAGALKARESVISLARNPLAPEPAAEAQALYGEGRDLGGMNQVDKAIAAERAAIKIFDTLKDSVGKFEALLMLGGLLRQKQDPTADEVFQQALDLARAESKWPAAMSLAASTLSATLTYQEPHWAEEYLKAVVILCDKFAKPLAYEKAAAEDRLGLLDYRKGNYDSAVKHYETGRAIDSKTVQALWPNLSKLEAQRAEAERAGDTANQQQLQAQEQNLQSSIVGSANYALLALNGLIAIDIDRGDGAAATAKLAQADVEIERYRLSSPMSGETQLLKANLATHRGELQAAGANLRTALSSSSQARDFSSMTNVLLGLARLSLAIGNDVTAGDYLRVAREFIGSPQSAEPPTYYHELELSALVSSRQNRVNDATDQLNSTISVYRGYGWQFDLARALRERVEEGLNQSDTQDRADVAEAKAIVARIAPVSFEAAHLETVEANLDYKAGQNRLAEQHDRAALQLVMTLAPHSFSVAALQMNLGKSLRHQTDSVHDPVVRERMLAEADELTAQGWKHAWGLQSEFYGDEASQKYSELLERYATDYAELQIGKKDYLGAFATLESSRARGFEELILEHRKLSGDLWSAHKYVIAQRYKTETDYVAAINKRVALSKIVADLQQSQSTDRAALNKAYRDLDDAWDDEDRASILYIMTLAGNDAFWAQLQKELANPNVQAEGKDKPRDELTAPPPASDIAKSIAAIPQGTVFVTFALGRYHLLVLAALGGRAEILTDIVDLRPAGKSPPSSGSESQSLSQQVWKFVDHVRHEPQLADVDAATAKIAAEGSQLFGELLPKQIGQAVLESEHVVISPDGFLWQMPFAALVAGSQLPSAPGFLGLSKPITYAQSLRLYLNAIALSTNSAPIGDAHALVVGDPKFDVAVATATEQRGDPVDTYFTPGQLWAGLFTRDRPPVQLKATRQEAMDVACNLGSKPLIDVAATESEVRKQIGSADVVHLATHGFLYPGLPMSSGLVFSPPADDAGSLASDNDGVLQAWEIFSELQLKARLVVLSACQTAQGYDVEGEGVIGLTRAFQYAGAESVVATLWTIDDRSTSELMREFYAKLIQGKPKDDALRDGMRRIASAEGAHAQPYWKHPYYWAAFTLIGDPSALKFAVASAPDCHPSGL